MIWLIGGEDDDVDAFLDAVEQDTTLTAVPSPQHRLDARRPGSDRSPGAHGVPARPRRPPRHLRRRRPPLPRRHALDARGFLGVEVFFVISGYLITLLLSQEFVRRDGIAVGQFWLRRARRLLAALYTLLAVVSTVVLVFYREDADRLAGQVWSALAYVTNWFLIVIDQSYFADRRAADGVPAPVVAGDRGAVLPGVARAAAGAAAGQPGPPVGVGDRRHARGGRLAGVDGRAVPAGDGSQPRRTTAPTPGRQACCSERRWRWCGSRPTSGGATPR